MSLRFKLNQGDFMEIVVTSISSGINILNLPDEQTTGFLSGFIDMCINTISDNPDIIADVIYTSIQNTLMAQRKDDFTIIQKEPQFKIQGEANFISMIKSYQEGGKDKLFDTVSKVMRANSQSQLKEEPIHCHGGDGRSIKDAVKVMTNDGHLGVKAEYWYLHYTYGRFDKISQHLIEGSNGIYYDEIIIDAPTGERRSIFFDISMFYP